MKNDVRLDPAFPSDQKIVDLALAARGLYITLLCWTKSQKKEGSIPERIPKFLCGLLDDDYEIHLEELLKRKLLMRTPEGFMFPPEVYRKWQLSEELREARKEAGATGGYASAEARRDREIERQNQETDDTPYTITEEQSWAGTQEILKLWHRPGGRSENEQSIYNAYRVVVRNLETQAKVKGAVLNYMREIKGWSKDYRSSKVMKLVNFLETGKWRKYEPSSVSPATVPAEELPEPPRMKPEDDEYMAIMYRDEQKGVA